MVSRVTDRQVSLYLISIPFAIHVITTLLGDSFAIRADTMSFAILSYTAAILLVTDNYVICYYDLVA